MGVSRPNRECVITKTKQALKVGPDQPVEVGNDDIFVIATGELKLSTSIPNECTKLESSGYLCRKRPGDIVTKMSTQNDVKRKVRIASALHFVARKSIDTIC